jgi:hypothetical protein
MLEATNTSEISVKFYQTTLCDIRGNSHLGPCSGSFTTVVTVQLEIKTAGKAKHKVGNTGIPEEENTKIKLEI